MAITSRQTISPSIKSQLIKQLQSGQVTMDVICDKYKVQPYQVYAWVGQGMLKGELSPPEAPKAEALQSPIAPDSRPTQDNIIERLRLTRLDPGNSAIDPDLARVVGEWWLRERLPQRLAAEGK